MVCRLGHAKRSQAIYRVGGDSGTRTTVGRREGIGALYCICQRACFHLRLVRSAPLTLVVVEARACSHLLWWLRCNQVSESESDGITRGASNAFKGMFSNIYNMHEHELLWLRLVSRCPLVGVLLEPGIGNICVPHLC